MRVYFSASAAEQDLDLLRELLKQLATPTATGVTLTSALDVTAGGDVRSERLRLLAEADVIALLISADFHASDRCTEEAREAMVHRGRRGAAVVPVLLRPADGWTEQPYGALKPLPADGRFVTAWADLDQALSAVAAGLRAELRGQQSRSGPRPGPTAIPPPAAVYDQRHYVTRPKIERNAHRRLAGAGAAVALQGPWGFGKATLVSHLLAALPAGRAVRLDLGVLPAVPGDLAALLRWFGEHLVDALCPGQRDLLDQAFRRPGTDEARLGWLLEKHLLPRCAPLYICLERAHRLHGQGYEHGFFAMLRGWVERSKQHQGWAGLRLLLTVSTEPAYLDNSDHSGLFRDSAPLELPPLTQEQVAQMARPYGYDGDGGVERVWRRTGGHPFLARLWLYEAAMREEPLAEVPEQEVFASHLRGVARYLKEKALWPAVRQVLDGREEPDSEAYLELYSRGLAYEVSGVYRLRNPLYQEFAETRCPGR